MDATPLLRRIAWLSVDDGWDKFFLSFFLSFFF